MDALLMCGGEGTRLDAPVEKPLLEVAGDPMVDRVREGLAGSRVETVHAVVSPHVPGTRDHLAGETPLIETPGEGYVADLRRALEAVEVPVLTVAADVPLLAADAVDRLLDAAEEGDEVRSTTAVVPVRLKRTLGLSVDEDVASEEWLPAGVNVVGAGPDQRLRTWDARLAVNVNRRRDAAVAEDLLAGGADRGREE